MTGPLVLVSRRVVTPDGVRPAAVVTEDGRIADLLDPADAPAHATDVGDLAVLPGLVDTHVHINEPGRTHWEGFETATRAAAAGGVTTLLDMPLNSIPPTTTPDALETKRAAASGRVHVDVGFWAGAVPGNEHHLDDLAAAGVFGFKLFLCDSGVAEYACVTPDAVPLLFARTARTGLPAIVHAEDPAVLARAAETTAHADRDPRRYTTWLDSRPAEAEVTAVTTLIDAARPTGQSVHVLHLSAAAAATAVQVARNDGLAITAETCPHYLTLAAEEIPDGATDHKCAPPIRDLANREELWAALSAGTIDLIVSDHSPCPPEDKRLDSGDFLRAWGGIASLQLGLPLVWTAARERGHDLVEVAGWMASSPARLVGLDRKGAIVPGRDADLVVFDPEVTSRVDPARLQHRHPITPYAGRELAGAVRTTYLRGAVVARDGRPTSRPTGRLLRRGVA